MGPQQTIGHYRISSKLGEGGMGAVYRATDTRLNRDVAIKVLPDRMASNPDRLARIAREARLLAALNHPNIATIYGVEGGAIVMELVEGVELHGPVPIETAISYARQIAEALEYAHEKGIVHRDLKPANLKVTADGRIKLLDFGLAKAAAESTAPVEASASPTISLTATEPGVVLGTAGYMSPEQARGKPVDKRTDIWSFGVVLYELLSGRPAFRSQTAGDSLAAVLTRDPDWSALPARTPRHVRELLERCLVKDPRLRLRDIGDARIALDSGGTASAVAPPAPASLRRSVLPWSAAALAVAGTAMLLFTRPKPVEPVPVAFVLPSPPGAIENRASAGVQAVPSPDGRLIAFIAASSDRQTSLWVRAIGSVSARRLERTEGANFPFWSPDSQHIGFFADRKLKRIPLAGGAPLTLSEVHENTTDSAVGDGGTWGSDDAIVYSSGRGSTLMRVPASGGPGVPVTTLDTAAGETRHSWPQFLPGSRKLLYFALNQDLEKSAVYVQEPGSPKRVLVLRNRTRAEWSPPGYLLFPRGGTLFAQRMDPETLRLTGEPMAVAHDVTYNESNGRSSFAVSSADVLVYRGGTVGQNAQLAWYTREGKRESPVGDRRIYVSVRVSPDEKFATIAEGVYPRLDVWIMDLSTGVLSRMTSDQQSSTALGPWSADSQRIIVNRVQPRSILQFQVGSAASRVVSSNLLANDWSPDGHFLLCTDVGLQQLFTVPLEGGAAPQPVSTTPFQKHDFAFRPDGKYVAYTSLEPGARISLAPYPSLAGSMDVSRGYGVHAAWRADGGELYFLQRDGTLNSVEVHSGAGKIEAGSPKPLFRLSPPGVGMVYAPSRNGQRFLVIEPEANPVRAENVVVVNWTALLKH